MLFLQKKRKKNIIIIKINRKALINCNCSELMVIIHSAPLQCLNLLEKHKPQSRAESVN